MDRLEVKIREALIERRFKETCELLEKPEYMASLSSILKKIAHGALEGFMEYEGDKLFAPIVAVMASEIDKKIDKVVHNPELIKRTMYENTRNSYFPKEKPFEDLEKASTLIGKESIGKLRTLYEKAVRRSYQNQIVSGLVEIAREDGLRKALTKESEYSMVRKIFPTPKQYLDDSMSKRTEIMDLISDFQKAIPEKSEEGKLMGKILEKIKGSIYEMREILDNHSREISYDRMKKIYPGYRPPRHCKKSSN